MNRFIKTALIASTFAAAPAMAATPMTLDFTNSTAKQVEVKTNPDNWYGNTRTFTFGAGADALNVKATAWHRTAVDPDYNSVKSAYLGWFTGANTGLGVTARNEGEGSGATHTIDNQYGWDFLVLQFDKSVSLSNGVFNAYKMVGLDYTDNDAFIGVSNLTGAWNQALNITSWDAFSKGFTGTLNTSGDGVVASQKIDMSGKAGNMWVIGAAIGGAASGTTDSLHDAFKLGAVTVSVVPEPTTWAMMLVGFGMVGAAARYRRRKTVAAIA